MRRHRDPHAPTFCISAVPSPSPSPSPSVRTRLQRDPSARCPCRFASANLPRSHFVNIVKLESTRPHTRISSRINLELTKGLPFWELTDNELSSLLFLGELNLTPTPGLSELSETDLQDVDDLELDEYVVITPVPTHIPASPTSSTSSFDELDFFVNANMDRKTAKTMAEVVAPSVKYAPIMTAGDVTPDVLLTFMQRCRHYFKAKGIAEADQVAAVAPSFQDSGIANWFLTNEARFQAMKFGDFIKEFRKRWFKRNWADNIRTELELSNMNDEDHFDLWIEKIERLNELLTDTEYFLPAQELRKHIKFHSCLKLRLAASSIDGSAKTTYDDLKDYLSQRDEERREDLAQIRAAARRAIGSSSGSASRNSQSTRPTRDENSAPTAGRPALPKLSNAERQLLMDNSGCFKCRRPFADHNSRTCPNGFPDARSYKPLTASDVQNARTAAANKAPAKNRVAAIDEIDDFDDTVLVAAVRSQPTRNTARALPSAVLSRADDEFSSSDESECVPSAFSRPHFIFRAAVHAPSSISEPIPMLIDTGSPVVLVDNSLVDRLQLRRRQLPTQKSFTTAWGGEEQVATEWVKLRVSSANLAWTSRSVRAIVVSGLFSPVILGLPFFASNDCNIDPVSCTLLDRATGSDLLHPSPPPPKDTRSPRERLQEKNEMEQLRRMLAITQHRDVVRELQMLFRDTDHTDNPTRRTPRVSTALPHETDGPQVLAALKDRIESLAFLDTLKREDSLLRAKFSDCFGDIPPTCDLPTDVWHRFRLRDPDMVIARRQYECPKKYREVWKELLTEHLDAGRLVPSSSPYASPCFLIPKSDPTAKPRWVNDYRALNANTVPDVHPLPSIAEILSDCGKGQFWAKLDMTNSFFQTRVHPDDQQYTAVTTPFGLYEWTVMPQGCRNAPATHQRRMYNALRPYIGSICHVYLDDIIIWSSTLEEHRKNVTLVLEALRAHSLFCSPKKTDLFCVELDFLGHHISRRGIEADGLKIDSVLSWPTPRSATHVRSFLGLVRYIAAFLPALAQHTRVLNQLTTKEAEKDFTWGVEHALAFDAIKALVTSRQCLTTIDHSQLDTKKIFVSCDASDFCTGAVLSFGETVETARPVAFESQPLRAAELNYPVHEKELLAIVRALKKWRVDLIGVPFQVFTDHRTLENFDKQKNLSRRQARWQEQLAQYNFTITYIEGERNSPADTMSRRPDVVSADVVGAVWVATRSLSRSRSKSTAAITAVNAVNHLTVSSDPSWLQNIRDGYATDNWTVKLLDSLWSTLPAERRAEAGDRSPLQALDAGLLDEHSRMGITVRDRLLYVGERLVVPRVNSLREDLFQLAHDALGHFGMDKSYGALRSGYYWPHMRKDMESLYLPGCEQCQRNKSPTHKPRGPLHPLPVPDGRCQSVAIDFVGPLPEDNGFNCIVTMTCRLGSDFRAVPTRTNISAEDFAALFFREWYCNNGLPLDIVSDRDKLFVSKFWKALTRLTGVKLKMSSSYHPETDGSSERSNKTLIQALRYHVQRNQRGWARALPHIRFNFMNTVNASTGFSPFQLRHGRSPLLIPPILAKKLDIAEEVDAAALVQQLEADVMEAQDNLLLAKTAQVTAADRDRAPEREYKTGDLVMLSTFHRRREYMQKGDKRVAKFMCRYDGPYEVVQSWPDTSVYTLNLPDHLSIFPTFHASLLKPFTPNNVDLFPSRSHPEPPPVITPDGPEQYVDKILERRKIGRGYRYLVRWVGFGPNHDSWLPGREVKDLIQLTEFLREQGIDDPEGDD